MLPALLFAASFTLAQPARDPSVTPKGDETFPLWAEKAPLAVGVDVVKLNKDGTKMEGTGNNEGNSYPVSGAKK